MGIRLLLIQALAQLVGMYKRTLYKQPIQPILSLSLPPPVLSLGQTLWIQMVCLSLHFSRPPALSPLLTRPRFSRSLCPQPTQDLLHSGSCTSRGPCPGSDSHSGPDRHSGSATDDRAACAPADFRPPVQSSHARTANGPATDGCPHHRQGTAKASASAPASDSAAACACQEQPRAAGPDGHSPPRSARSQGPYSPSPTSRKGAQGAWARCWAL